MDGLETRRRTEALTRLLADAKTSAYQDGVDTGYALGWEIRDRLGGDDDRCAARGVCVGSLFVGAIGGFVVALVLEGIRVGWR